MLLEQTQFLNKYFIIQLYVYNLGYIRSANTPHSSKNGLKPYAPLWHMIGVTVVELLLHKKVKP